MSLSNSSVPLSTKTDVIFAPISDCKLLPPEHIKLATSEFRLQTETSALVAVAAASKSSKFKGSKFGKFSPLNKYKGGKGRGSGKSSRKFFLKNKDLFARRDRFARGRGQGKKSQPSTSSQ